MTSVGTINGQDNGGGIGVKAKKIQKGLLGNVLHLNSALIGNLIT